MLAQPGALGTAVCDKDTADGALSPAAEGWWPSASSCVLLRLCSSAALHCSSTSQHRFAASRALLLQASALRFRILALHLCSAPLQPWHCPCCLSVSLALHFCIVLLLPSHRDAP